MSVAGRLNPENSLESATLLKSNSNPIHLKNLSQSISLPLDYTELCDSLAIFLRWTVFALGASFAIPEGPCRDKASPAQPSVCASETLFPGSTISFLFLLGVGLLRVAIYRVPTNDISGFEHVWASPVALVAHSICHCSQLMFKVEVSLCKDTCFLPYS
ncbi:hypothetical protein C0J52_07365 [Blattella germanica]|nr:hypothetical protein C0J52_07365 [Blattella germanica]